MNKDAKILIAGTAGMVGSAIVRKLLSLGYTNLVGSYHSKRPDGTTFLCKTESREIPDGLRLVQTDLCRQTEVEAFFANEKPAYVFLAAAKVGGIYANNSYPAQFIHENLSIQSNIIHTAYQSGVERLLFLGSSCIYPKLAPQPIKEDHLLTGLLEPTNEPYAIAKIAGIKMCEAYNRQYGTRFIAVMPTNLYGPNDNFDLENSHVLPALIRKFHLAKLAENGDWDGIENDEARFGPIPEDLKQTLHSALNTQSSAHSTHALATDTQSPALSTSTLRSRATAPVLRSSATAEAGEDGQHSVVSIWGTGQPRREFLYVDDMADACVHVMNLDTNAISKHLLNYPKPCFVNVGSGTDCRIRELAETIQEVVDFQGELVFDTSKPDGNPQKLLNVSKLTNMGWKAAISLTEGVRRTYQWYLGQNS